MNRASYRLLWGAVFISFSPILVRLLSLNAMNSAFWRCLVASTAFIALMVYQGFKPGKFSDFKRLLKKTKGLMALAGLIFALDLYVWHQSIFLVGAGMATILGNTQVFHVAFLGVLIFGEKLSTRVVLSIVLGFVGIYFLVVFQDTGQVGAEYSMGVGLGLLAGVLYALLLLTLKYAQRVMGSAHSLGISALVTIAATLSLAAMLPLDTGLMWPSWNDWGWLMLLGAVVHVGGWLLINENLPHVPLASSGLILLLQPAMATVLGAWLFGERLGHVQLMGAGFTLVAIYLGISGGRRRRL